MGILLLCAITFYFIKINSTTEIQIIKNEKLFTISNNKKKAISILANLVDYGTSPIMILNMIARHYRILIRAKEVEKLGSRPEVASYLGVNPYFVKNYMAQAKNYSLEQLKHKFSDLSECDRELKSSRVPNRIILEKLILS